MMKKTTEQFVNQAQQVHNGKYDYSDTVYLGVSKKVTIRCSLHGTFAQLPGNHLSRKSGCPECAKSTFGATKHRSARNTFIEDCTRLHGGKYDYSKTEYTKSHNKIVVTCPTHGDFTLAAYSHKQGRGCAKCSIEKRSQAQTHTTDSFIQKSIAIHGTKYIYDYVDYISAKTKVQIICPTHGPFFQRPGQHVRGEGCPECGRQTWWAQQGGYTPEYFNANPGEQSTPATLYLVKFYNNQETFYKIGITKNTIKQRFHWGYSEYDMDIISLVKTTLYEAYLTEQKILNDLTSNRYVPKVKIGGWTECLSTRTDIPRLIAKIESAIPAQRS